MQIATIREQRAEEGKIKNPENKPRSGLGCMALMSMCRHLKTVVFSHLIWYVVCEAIKRDDTK